jgi:hypothetical protein
MGVEDRVLSSDKESRRMIRLVHKIRATSRPLVRSHIKLTRVNRSSQRSSGKRVNVR